MIATIGDKDSSPGRGSCSPSQFVTIIIITITTTNIIVVSLFSLTSSLDKQTNKVSTQ